MPDGGHEDMKSADSSSSLATLRTHEETKWQTDLEATLLVHQDLLEPMSTQSGGCLGAEASCKDRLPLVLPG